SITKIFARSVAHVIELSATSGFRGKIAAAFAADKTSADVELVSFSNVEPVHPRSQLQRGQKLIGQSSNIKLQAPNSKEAPNTKIQAPVKLQITNSNAKKAPNAKRQASRLLNR